MCVHSDQKYSKQDTRSTPLTVVYFFQILEFLITSGISEFLHSSNCTDASNVYGLGSGVDSLPFKGDHCSYGEDHFNAKKHQGKTNKDGF